MFQGATSEFESQFTGAEHGCRMVFFGELGARPGIDAGPSASTRIPKKDVPSL